MAERAYLFMGHDKLSLVFGQFINGKLFIRVRWLLFFKKWIPVVGGITESQVLKDAQEMELYVPMENSSEPVKVFFVPRSLETFKPYYPMMAATEKREKESIMMERDYFEGIAATLEEYIRSVMSEDEFFERFADRFKKFDSLKPTTVNFGAFNKGGK